MSQGSDLAAILRRRCHIGPRTRWDRDCEWLSMDDDTYDEMRHHLSAVDASIFPVLPGYTDEEIRLFRLADDAWNAIRAYANPDLNRERYARNRNEIEGFTPWQWTARLGEMVDAGVTTVEQAKAWHAEKCAEGVNRPPR